MIGPAAGCMAASHQDSDSVRWTVVGSYQVERWEVGVGDRVDDPRMSVAAVRACQRNTWPQSEFSPTLLRASRRTRHGSYRSKAQNQLW